MAPSSSCFATVKAACEDPLTVAKLEMFISVAKHLQPFLTKFRTDSPVVSFLGPELKTLMAGLMSCFVRKEHLEEADTHQELQA